MRSWLLTAAAGAILFAMPAIAANWQVDPASSKLGFEVAVNGEAVQGQFGQWTADIQFDPADLGQAKAKVTIDLASASTGNSTRDTALPGDKFFDVAGSTFSATPAAPAGQAVFETSAFRQTGDNTYEADGTLTMRGVSHPLTLPFTLEIDGTKAHMVSTVPIDRTQWGVGQGDYADDKPVATQVNVMIDLNATRQ